MFLIWSICLGMCSGLHTYIYIWARQNVIRNWWEYQWIIFTMGSVHTRDHDQMSFQCLARTWCEALQWGKWSYCIPSTQKRMYNSCMTSLNHCKHNYELKSINSPLIQCKLSFFIDYYNYHFGGMAGAWQEYVRISRVLGFIRITAITFSQGDNHESSVNVEVSGDNIQVITGKCQVSSDNTISINPSSENMKSDKQSSY